MPENPGDKEGRKDTAEGKEKDKVDNKVNGVTSNNTESLRVQAKETIAVLQKCEGYIEDEPCGGKGIALMNAYAKWVPEVSEDTLSNVSMTVTPGKLTAIIGPVGAGKVNISFLTSIQLTDCLE